MTYFHNSVRRQLFPPSRGIMQVPRYLRNVFHPARLGVVAIAGVGTTPQRTRSNSPRRHQHVQLSQSGNEEQVPVTPDPRERS